MMHRIQETVPDAVSSDFIVGFCGETDEDFQQTVKLVKECRFKNSFIFKYSERPGTKGAELLKDDVPIDVKQRRNNELLAVQTAISEEDNQDFIGRTVPVLIEGPSKRAVKQGSEDDPILQLTMPRLLPGVTFEGNRRQIGETLPITIYDATAYTLFETSSRELRRGGDSGNRRGLRHLKTTVIAGRAYKPLNSV